MATRRPVDPKPDPTIKTPEKPTQLRHEDRLLGVDQRLVDIVREASRIIPITVIEGLRSKERQAALYAQGRTTPGQVVTWTLKSKHIDGLAVDIGPHPLKWDDKKGFLAVAGAIQHVAAQRGIGLRWGADWNGNGKIGEKGESDIVHWELK